MVRLLSALLISCNVCQILWEIKQWRLKGPKIYFSADIISFIIHPSADWSHRWGKQWMNRWTEYKACERLPCVIWVFFKLQYVVCIKCETASHIKHHHGNSGHSLFWVSLHLFLYFCGLGLFPCKYSMHLGVKCPRKDIRGSVTAQQPSSLCVCLLYSLFNCHSGSVRQRQWVSGGRR